MHVVENPIRGLPAGRAAPGRLRGRYGVVCREFPSNFDQILIKFSAAYPCTHVQTRILTGILFFQKFNSLHKHSFSESNSDSDTFNVSGGREKPLEATEYVPVNTILQEMTSGRHHLAGRIFEKISAADQVDDFR